MTIPRTWVYCDARGAFGNSRGGHYLYGVDGSKELGIPEGCPWPYLDGTLCCITKGYQRQGVATLHHKAGWTALAFWDRTGDSRPGSHSTFVYPGTLRYEDMLTQAEHDWPGLFDRYRRCGLEVRHTGGTVEG